MKAYGPYVDDLRRLLLNRRAEALFPQLAERAVNGEASERLLELVSASKLKRAGAFFSNSDLSNRVATGIPTHTPNRRILVADPACGAGDLLLGVANRFTIRKSLAETLSFWGKQLAGFDLHPEFIAATHFRLAILAVFRGAEFDLAKHLPLAPFFPLIRQGDGLLHLATTPGVTHVVMNPPYCPMTVPTGCQWATGKVTKAAVFLLRCLEILPPSAHINAILPDVLRAGARYQHWREAVELASESPRVTLLGNFKTADVDVFALELKVREQKAARSTGAPWWPKRPIKETVGDHFDVQVGPVVPFRLKKNEGPIYPFLHAKGLPFWGECEPVTDQVAFAGKSFRPPFVVVRRTSSPADRYRAIGTMIKGAKAVAVENHLLICIPKSGATRACKTLLSVLRRSETNDFMNNRIRCRHLTVGVVKEIPW